MIKVRLGTVAKEAKETVRAGTHELPIVGLEHLQSGELALTEWGEGGENTFTKLFRKGQVLFGRRRAYLKKAAIAPFDGICSEDITVIEALPEKLLPGLLPFVIQNDDFFSFAVGKSAGSLSPRVKWEHLRQYEFALPPLEEQARLFKLFEAAYAAREAYKKLLSATDSLIKSQFIEMFGDPVANPMGWECATIRGVAKRISDGPFGSNLKSEHYTPDGVRVIRLQNIGVRQFLDTDKAFVSLEHYEKIKKYTCRAGDVVVGTLGEPNLRACIVPEHIERAVNKADCVHFVPNDNIVNGLFVCHYLNQPATLILAGGSIHGQTRARISMSQVAALPIFLPPIELQNQFAAFVEQADKSKFALQSTLEKLEATYKGLLNKHLG